MDKQTLKKHHFWFLLALSVILVPVVLLGAVFSVGSAAVEAKSKIDKRNEELIKAAPKCRDYLANLDKQKAELESLRDKKWKEVYEAQAGLIHWPQRLAMLDKLYFGDKIAEDFRAVFRDKNVYLNEYWHLPAVIAPTEFQDNNDWSKHLEHVGEWQKLPTSEECWLALETLCVQREVLRDIQAVNQMLAGFLPVPRPLAADATPEQKAKYNEQLAATEKEVRESIKIQNVKDPKSIVSVGRFESPYWQLDLGFARDETGRGALLFGGKLTNVSGRRQNVSKIDFQVWLTDRSKDAEATPVIVSVQKDFLQAGASVTFDDVRVEAYPSARRIYGVTQKLDLRYAPVKRVDRLMLGYPSHRYANQPLVAPEGPAFKESTDAEAAAAPPPSQDGGVGPGRASASVRPNTLAALRRDRYLHRTEQVRRMPIAVVLVVDQAHIQDVERAFANSNLRFQNVQFHWTRFRGAINLGPTSPSMTTDPGKKPPGEVNPGSAGAPRPGGGTSAAGESLGPLPTAPNPQFGRPNYMPPRGGRPPNIPGMTGPGQPTAVIEEPMSSLVELTIYGVASLYERYPPRPPTAADGSSASPTSAPPTPAAAPPPGTRKPPPPPPPEGDN